MNSKLPSRLGNLKTAPVNYVILLSLGLDVLNVAFQQTAIFITIDFVLTPSTFVLHCFFSLSILLLFYIEFRVLDIWVIIVNVARFYNILCLFLCLFWLEKLHLIDNICLQYNTKWELHYCIINWVTIYPNALLFTTIYTTKAPLDSLPKPCPFFPCPYPNHHLSQYR